MINQERLQAILVEYKEAFVSQQWGNEKYKWEAVKHFQDNWDVNAPDFAEMLERSLAKTYNLLASLNNFPAGMITGFAKSAPEEVRALFVGLFDEGKDYFERIEAFKLGSSALLEKYGGDAGQHYQTENAITTYLWLRYPDRYYIYKYGEVRKVAEELGSGYRFKKGAYADNVRNHLALYDEICSELKKDEELVRLLKSQLTPECYPDHELRTLTIDVGFYISRNISGQGSPQTADWFPSPEEYDPGISVEKWASLLEDDSVFTAGSKEIVKRIKDYGGEASCTQLSVKYGETKNFYLTGSVSLARRVAEKTGCPLMADDSENSRWWPVLYVGRHADKDEEGSYVWRLRDELAQALDRVDLSGVPLFAEASEADGDRGYWWLNANPKIWSFSDIAVGEVQSYTLYNENGNKRRIFQNFLDAKAGDMIIGYESYPVKQVVAIGKISAEQDGKELYFEKVEGLMTPIDYQTLHDSPELEKMEYFVNPQGSLFKLTPGEYDFILDFIREENPIAAEEGLAPYDKDAFLSEVYMDAQEYERIASVLRKKKNIILQGAPGVGKTFAANRLAWSMMGEVDESRVEFVQFHQSYSYEDFIMGYKPQGDGFELKNGVFYRFCQKAANHPEKDFFFIIDEINRGNLSKIFGELLMLIENEYRGRKITLAYNGLPFSVPENLYIIGMMNTADRSLALIDYALRRRFSFFDLKPAFEKPQFIEYQRGLENETLDALIEKVKELNREIKDDKSLGAGFQIGHSYFCNRKKEEGDAWLQEVVECDLIPMIAEYWFDDDGKVQVWSSALRGVLQ